MILLRKYTTFSDATMNVDIFYLPIPQHNPNGLPTVSVIPD